MRQWPGAFVLSERAAESLSCVNGFSVRPCMCVSTHALRKGRPTACLVVTGDLRALCSLERMGRGSQPTKTHTHCVRLKLPQPLTPPSPKLLLSQQVCVCVRPRRPARSPVLRGRTRAFASFLRSARSSSCAAVCL